MGKKNNYINLECPTKQNKLKLPGHECEKNASLPGNKSSKVDKLLECFQLMLKLSFKEENKQTACFVTCLTERLHSDSIVCS